MMKAVSGRMILLLLAAGLLGILLLSVGSSPQGVESAPPAIVVRALACHVPYLSHYVTPVAANQDTMVWTIRVPRALGGALTGMLLALAGVAFQSFLMNPLADPYMIGVSAGSALGSAAVVLMGGTGWLAGFAQTAAAFGTGLTATLIIAAIARVRGRISAQSFLLAGFVVGAFVYSLTRLAVSIAYRSEDPGRAATILSQLLGSLIGMSWSQVLLLAVFGTVGSVILLTQARELNMMALGEESAAHQGVNTEALKWRIIIAGSLVTAATVAVAGIIGFIGMIVPHIARKLVGPDHRRLLPSAMLLGGIALTGSDWLARVYLNELEVGVVTALFGAPAFCYLLRRRLAARWV